MIRGGIGLADFRRLAMVPEPEGREALGRHKPDFENPRSIGWRLGRADLGIGLPPQSESSPKKQNAFHFSGLECRCPNFGMRLGPGRFVDAQ
jgi:hypothetical protein